MRASSPRHRKPHLSRARGFLFYKNLLKDYKTVVNRWKRISTKIKTAPKTPGVYTFYERENPLYVGKAANLKNRLQSYIKGADGKSERLREHATHLKLLPLRSEIEALIEEAKLIKKLNPPYNILWRDDKSYFYVVFTAEKFPRIFTTHKKLPATSYNLPATSSIGPFTEGRALRLVLRMLRRNFPYCTCPRSHFRLCLNAQIGNCQEFCCKKDASPTFAQIKNYQKNIHIIKNFLVGKPLKKFTKNLKSEEREALEKILAHREFLENFDVDGKPNNLKTKLPNCLIEGYDISHLSGRETVAGMTVWELAGETLRPRKEFWRKFIIRTAKPADDPAAIAETVSRRLNHPEWPYPDVMIIDGGLAQFNAAKEIVEKSEATKKIRVLSFGKPERLVYGLDPPHNGVMLGVEKNPKRLDKAPPELQKIIPAVIAETHSFAIRFHRERRRKDFLNFELDHDKM